MLNLSHKNLDVCKTSLLLVQEIYTLKKLFPKEEQYVLVSQLRRAAISVSINLAEGAARKSVKEKISSYEVSRSSLVAIDNQIEISLSLNYLQIENLFELNKYLESTFKMISKMIITLESKTLLPLPINH